MRTYISQKEVNGCKIVADDMLLTTDMPTTAGSKMLENYRSLFEAEVLTRLKNVGYGVCGKANVGEFAIDLLGETSYFGGVIENGVVKSPSAEIMKSGDVKAVVGLEVNGSIMRSAAQNNLCSIKPTYGTVSRYGTIPVVCSGETVSVLANDTKACLEVLNVISGHDDKDGTSLSDKTIADGKSTISKKNKVLVPACMLKNIDGGVKAALESAISSLQAQGVEVVTEEVELLSYASAAWNILMSAELCNNVSRYDGVKYGYRTQNYTNLDELYVNSRTEAFGELLKSAILFGSETLSTENYSKVYDKALRVRRVISEELAKIFVKFDGILLPACSTMEYTAEEVQKDKYKSFEENVYTAPAMISGCPAVVCKGVQIIGKAFSEELLLSMAENL